MKTLEEALSHVETLQHQNYEEDVVSTFRSLVPDGEYATGNLLHELIAFSFGEHNEKDELDWKTYFGPGMIWNNGETITVSPDISQVNQDAIDYWKKRIDETNNPLLKARYAGLVWDMEKKITGVKPNFGYAIIAAESLIALSENNRYKYDVAIKDKLKRALSLATGVNKPELVERVKQSIISYEDKIAVDDKPGLWGFAFEYLIDNKKAQLTEDEEESIISSLKSRLERLTEEQPNAHAAEHAATMLADYYQKRSKNQDVKKVMLQLGKAYEADEDPSVLNKVGRLEHLHKLYVHYHLHEEAKDLLVKLRAMNAGVKDELQTFSQEVTVPKEDIDQFLNAILNYDEKTVTGNIVSYFTPDKEENEVRLKQLAKAHPFTFMFSEKIIDERGRPIAVVGSIFNDLDGRVLRQISQSMTYSGMFIHLTLKAYFDKFEIDTRKFINEYMEVSPVFMFGRWNIIERALDAYFLGDYMTFIHFMIPQVEDAFRTLVEISGGQIMKLARGGALHLKTFDDILRDESITRIFGEDFALYSRILFTEQRGWNLRNDLCHGLMSEERMGVMAADRIFHILMAFSLLITGNEDTKPDQSDITQAQE